MPPRYPPGGTPDRRTAALHSIPVSVESPFATTDSRLYRLLWLSIVAAVVTISLKTAAWLLTGSVGLLSDAAESVVNLVAAVVALAALRWAAKPADEEHSYGHAKAEYFSAGIEGGLILLAAVTIAATAIDRLLHPQALSDVRRCGGGRRSSRAAGARKSRARGPSGSTPASYPHSNTLSGSTADTRG